jgi:lysophospholipase L1-like esterase
MRGAVGCNSTSDGGASPGTGGNQGTGSSTAGTAGGGNGGTASAGAGDAGGGIDPATGGAGATGTGGSSVAGTGGSPADAGTTPADGSGAGGVGATGGGAGAAGSAPDGGGLGGAGATGGRAGAAGSSSGGAAGGGAGGGSGSAGSGYNPCPAAGSACLIMPLGDSITQGKSGSSDQGGYRETLWRLARNAGKSIKLVGSQSNGPTTVDGASWTRTHEGYSGYTIDHTSANTAAGRSNGALTRNMLTPNNIKTYKPHIVLLMIGTNDLSIGEDMPSIRLANLVDTILTTDANVLLFVTQITPGPKSNPDTYNNQVTSYNAAISTIVSVRAAAGKHVRLMDMNTPFTSVANYSTTLLSGGGVHPNDAGYKLMGETWYATLAPLIH